MKLLLCVPLLGLLALLQSSLLPHFSIIGAHPDLVLLAVVSWTLLRGLTEGLTWAFVGGLWLEALSGAPFGLSLLALVLVAFLVSPLETTLFRQHIVFLIATVTVASFANGAVYLLLLRLSGNPGVALAALWRIVIPVALYTGLLTPIFYPGFRWLHRITWREQLEW